MRECGKDDRNFKSITLVADHHDAAKYTFIDRWNACPTSGSPRRCRELPPMNVLDRVRRIIANYMRLPEAELTARTRLQDIGVQSIDILELAFALEKEFGVDLPFNLSDGDPNWFAT